MEMEIEGTCQNLNEVSHCKKVDNSKTSAQNYVNGTLGRGINVQNDEESFLELSDRLPLLDININQEQLNNNLEQFICSKCHAPKPSARLLDIHIQEDHDNIFFKLLSERQPMYECYIESCDIKFNSPSERDEHCISIHKYNKSFGSFLHRKQFEKCKPTEEPNTSRKRQNTDDFQINKKIATGSSVINKQTEQSKSTLSFVPRQILDKVLGINLRTNLT